MSDPTGKYDVAWHNGRLTCTCRSFRYGNGRWCKHIQWLSDNDKLPPEPEQRTLGEAITGPSREEDRPADAAGPPKEEMECFPQVPGSQYPMSLSTFLRGIIRVVIEYRHGGLWPDNIPSVTRMIERSPVRGLVRVSWIANKGSETGYTDVPEEGPIEHRGWKGDKTQRTVMGAGGRLWLDGDKVVFITQDGRELSEEQWLEERSDLVRPSP